MTDREISSMVSIKKFLDSYFDLPLSVRAMIDGRMDKAIGEGLATLKMYSNEVRSDITTAVNSAGINKKVMPNFKQDEMEVP